MQLKNTSILPPSIPRPLILMIPILFPLIQSQHLQPHCPQTNILFPSPHFLSLLISSHFMPSTEYPLFQLLDTSNPLPYA